jgi:hypothetical protein
MVCGSVGETMCAPDCCWTAAAVGLEAVEGVLEGIFFGVEIALELTGDGEDWAAARSPGIAIVAAMRTVQIVAAPNSR